MFFTRDGTKVAQADINRDAASRRSRLLRLRGGVCEAVAGNASRADDVAVIVDTCLTGLGRVDRQHNNVGTVEVGGPVEAGEGLKPGQRHEFERHVPIKNNTLRARQAGGRRQHQWRDVMPADDWRTFLSLDPRDRFVANSGGRSGIRTPLPLVD